MNDNVKKELPVVGIVFLIIIILVIPILLGVYNQESSSLGFWGSYLGGIVGMIAVVVTTFILISNQNKQHFELLAEQKNSIDEAAEINDKKTREREHKLFLLTKHEKLIDSIVNLMKQIKMRNEILRKMNNIGKELLHLNDLQGEIIQNGISFNKEDSMHNLMISLIGDNKTNMFRESELFAEIEILISEIKMLYALLEYDSNEVEEFRNNLIEHANSMIEMTNNKKFDEVYLQKIREFDRISEVLLNKIMNKHVAKHKLLFEDYKK